MSIITIHVVLVLDPVAPVFVDYFVIAAIQRWVFWQMTPILFALL
jgi:hypothetical protein